MLMQIELTQSEFIQYALLAGIILGVLLGLIPLILGIKRNKRKLGVIGFISSILIGALSGILSILVAGIFIWLILKKDKKKDNPIDVRVVNENPIDVNIDRPENR